VLLLRRHPHVVEAIFKWVKHGDVMVNVNTAGTMSDASWSMFVAELGARDYTRYIGASLGNFEITAVQRKDAAAALRGNGVAVAIVTNDVLVRGLVTAVSWLGANVKSFARADTSRALVWLGVAEREVELLSLIEHLERECLAEERQRTAAG
jgi:hypothetical protein